MECPKCKKEFEACPLCRLQENHQLCVPDDICDSCFWASREPKTTEKSEGE